MRFRFEVQWTGTRQRPRPRLRFPVPALWSGFAVHCGATSHAPFHAQGLRTPRLLVGNRLSSLGVPLYSYNVSNELTSNSGGSYTYDNNGNTLSDTSGKSYTWDFENRMTQAVVPGTGTVTFKYDPFGRRVHKSSVLGTSSYLYDFQNLVQTVGQNGTGTASFATTLSVDEILAGFISGTVNYYEEDGLTSVTSLSNSSASLSSSSVFDSYGNLAASSGTSSNQFKYTARELDLETGVYYYRARYYDPTAGRFLSEDPLEFGAGVNFYAYVRNNPETLIDPDGLLQACCRRANVSVATGWARLTMQRSPCHCFVKLSDGTTLGGYFGRKFGSIGDLVTEKNNVSDHDKVANDSSCGDVPGSCDKRALNAFNSMDSDLGTYGFSPGDAGTSNRVAVEILSRAGVNWQPPSCAWGYRVPRPLPPIPQIRSY